MDAWENRDLREIQEEDLIIEISNGERMKERRQGLMEVKGDVHISFDFR